MRPVAAVFRVSQFFASMPTAGVAPSLIQGTVGWYVHLYGNYQPHGHAGMDFACPIGTPIHAMAAGTVLYAGWGHDLPGAGPVRAWLLYANFPGKVTVIQHPGWVGIYAHQSEFRVVKGDRVAEGQIIGLSGNTGGVAAHLHVEALVDLSYRTGNGRIYGRDDPSKFFGSALAAQGSTTTPSEEDDVSAQEVMSWPVERTDGQKTRVIDVLAALPPDLAKLDVILAVLAKMAPEVTESMLNDRKQINSLEGLWAAVAEKDVPGAVDQLVAAGIAEQVLDLLSRRIGGQE